MKLGAGGAVREETANRQQGKKPDQKTVRTWCCLVTSVVGVALGLRGAHLGLFGDVDASRVAVVRWVDLVDLCRNGLETISRRFSGVWRSIRTLLYVESINGAANASRTLCKLMMKPCDDTLLGSTRIAARFALAWATLPKYARTASRCGAPERTMLLRIWKRDVCRDKMAW